MGRPRRNSVTKEEVIRGLKSAIDDAKAAGNLNAQVAAWEKLGKTLAMFTDVQQIDSRFVDMTPERFTLELRELVEDDVVREYLRACLEAYDAGRSGGGSGRVSGGEAPQTGPVPAEAAPARIPRGRIH